MKADTLPTELVLLNSEGAILTAKRHSWAGVIRFQILDQWRLIVAVWTPEEITAFVHGDLRRLDEFLGRDTRGLTY